MKAAARKNNHSDKSTRQQAHATAAAAGASKSDDPLIARSPPAAKNLQHVPCKFYRSGQCTAGRNCVFSHTVEQEQERQPCKYFQKGNCRFGAKCALAHILPDGRRVNHTTSARQHHGLHIGPRIVPEHRQHQSSGIHAELLQSQSQPASGETEAHVQSQSTMHSLDSQFADLHVAHHEGERFKPGSAGRTSAAFSPRPLGPLDAQLPASLDSNGISYFARHGPVAASVPHTTSFGIPDRASHPSSPLHHPSNLQPSASLFGPLLGTSPRAATGSLTLGRAIFERRASALDSQMAQDARQSSTPSSLPFRGNVVHRSSRNTPHEERGEDPFVFEEDYVPSSLNAFLRPAEQDRRPSALFAREEALTMHLSKSPTGSNSGSPSSSRFGALFQKHKEKEILSSSLTTPMTTFTPGTSSPRVNPAMIVGSPLARDIRSGAPSPSLILSPVRTSSMLAGMSSAARQSDEPVRRPDPPTMPATDLRGAAKEFRMSTTQSDEEPFEMDI